MKRYLILENGETFEGLAFGDTSKNASGELVFTTIVTGFNEFIASPKNYGKLALFTFPSIGNCGLTDEEMGIRPHLSACIVHEWCDAPSSENAPYTLDAYLKKHGIPGIYGIDCRALTRIIRENGTVNAIIADEMPQDITAFTFKKEGRPLEAVNEGKLPRTYLPRGEVKCRAALYDLGAPNEIVKTLLSLGCAVTSVPAPASEKDILRYGADFTVIGDGAGDPEDHRDLSSVLLALANSSPVLAVGFGHLLLSSALGGKAEKLPYGHRGASQPVKDTVTKKTLITTQNHAYTVSADSVKLGSIRFTNANDGTVEGIEYENILSTEFTDTNVIAEFIKKIGATV